MPNGKIGLCGHMVNAPEFSSLEELNNSKWLAELKSNEDWADDCHRCQQEEELNQKSIRQHALERHKFLSKFNTNYLIIGGILDNICNSACQFCNENLSTKIGSLKYGKDYNLINNYDVFYTFPQDSILELDINGGEPTNSPNYQKVLENLPSNLKILRINTNASRLITNIENILDKKIKVIVTISFDGVDKIYNYARFPLKWEIFTKVVDQYRDLSKRYNNLELNFWSTICAYNIADLPNIINYANKVNIDLSYGYLQEPKELQIFYTNPLTLSAKEKLDNITLSKSVASKEDNTEQLLKYLKIQDKIRGTNFKNYYDWVST